MNRAEVRERFIELFQALGDVAIDAVDEGATDSMLAGVAMALAAARRLEVDVTFDGSRDAGAERAS